MPEKNIQIVFMGSPDFALPTLKALADHFSVAGVVTQPDRPAGRGRTLTPPPVKELALERNLPIIQPRNLKEEDAKEQLRNWKADVIIVAAFGQILPPEILELPAHGCINVHASLLPRWRGAAPIQAAILHGDEITGITIMEMDSGLDTGPIIDQRTIPIQPDDTAGSLSQKLAHLGGEMIVESLTEYLSGDLVPKPQDDSKATYAPMLNKSDGELDFKRPAKKVSLKIRAYNPWPGTFIYWKDKRLKIYTAHAVPTTSPGPGVRTKHANLPAIGTEDGIIVFDKVQPAGKQKMPGEAFLRGARDWEESNH